MRRTTIVSVTKMLRLHSLSSLRDGPFGPALDPSKPQSRDYFHRWDTSKTSRFALENCHFLFKIRSFPHEIRAWPGGRVPARKKILSVGKKKHSVLVSEKEPLLSQRQIPVILTFDRTGTARFYQTTAPLQARNQLSWTIKALDQAGQYSSKGLLLQCQSWCGLRRLWPSPRPLQRHCHSPMGGKRRSNSPS